MTLTCGDLAALADATKDKLTKDDLTLDAHVAFTNAGKNPPATVCRVAASSVLLLTSLMFGAAIKAAPATVKEPPKVPSV